MDNVISITERRLGRAASPPAPRNRFARTTFAFDLALPQTYLAAERVDRLVPGVCWQPVSAESVWGERATQRRADALAAAPARAEALGAPLILPEPYPPDVRPAMRAAALACETGHGAAFVLAAMRLAFCGGFDLSDPEVLAEAAAAAGVPLGPCLDAARDPRRDADIELNSRRLAATGADDVPALRVGRVVFAGEERLPEALAALAAPAAERGGRPKIA